MSGAGGTPQTRADAIRVVGLTPEQADALIDLSIERNMKSIGIGRPTGEPPDEKAQAELKRLGEARRRAIARIARRGKVRKVELVPGEQGERSEASQFRAQLSTTSEPLQDRQADALVEALSTPSASAARANTKNTPRPAGITDRNVVSPQDRQRWLDLEKEANQRIHDTMAGTLSRPQLSSLDEMLAARLVPIEAALRLQLEGRLAKGP